jgi:thiamine kinase-like enzyme
MIITAFGRSFLTSKEVKFLMTDKGIHSFQKMLTPMTDGNTTWDNVQRAGRLVLKTNNTLFTKNEVLASSRLSLVSPIFLPLLAYDSHTVVTPFVNGVSLFDSGMNSDAVNTMSYLIAEALLKADIVHGDLHNENVIVTSASSFHVVDLEQFKPMDKYTRKSLPELANIIFEDLTDEDS